MRIPETYRDRNPEDRNYTEDFWAWLQHQPLQAWLFFAREANWDQAELLFVAMVRHPRCDVALASWLFWSANPSWFLSQGERPGVGTLLGEILCRAEGEGFAPATLHYSRVEVARQALEAANAIMKRSGDAPSLSREPSAPASMEAIPT